MEIRVMARRGESGQSDREAAWTARATRCGGICVTRRRVATGRAQPRACKLDEYKGYLRERIEQARPRWIPATVLLREIRERGYDGGISQLKAWLAPLKKNEPEPVGALRDAAGQADAGRLHLRPARPRSAARAGGDAGLQPGQLREVRASGEDAATLCAGLREAFDYFGGVPEHVLFDNTKAVVIERDAYGEGLHRWNDELRALGRGVRLHAAAVPAVSGQDQGQGRALQRVPEGQLPRAAGGDAAGQRPAPGARAGQRPRAPLARRGRQRPRARHHQGRAGACAWPKSAPSCCPRRRSRHRRRMPPARGAAGGEPAASAGGLRRAAGGGVMSLQHERIAALCEQLKLARLATEWPALAQDAARDGSQLRRLPGEACSPARSSRASERKTHRR